MNKIFVRFLKNAKVYISTNILFFTFVLTSLINGWLLRLFTVGNAFALKPLLADIAVILLIGAFGYFIKPKNQFKYFFSWGAFISLLTFTNSVYYTNYLSFASVSLLATTFQLFDVADAVIENVFEVKDLIFLWQIIALLVVNYILKKRDYYKRVSSIEVGKIRALNTLVASLITTGFFISMLTGLDVSRLGKQWNREYIVMQFGFYTYQINDIFSSLKPKISPLFGYDEKAKVFREFYENRNTDKKTNKYTNVFKGKNIITIHAESMQKFAMDLTFNGKELTPNLNKLAKSGLFFSNFYAQEAIGTSSDSEFTLNTSLLPISSGTVFINYFDREYVTIPKMLKELGYYSFSMHGNNGTYWNRNVVHKEFGYDYFYYYKKDFVIDEEIGLGLSDKSFFRQAIPKIKEVSENHQNFYGTMIMLTNHTPFSDIVNKNLVDFELDYKYEKLNEETNEIEIVSAPYLEGTKMGNYLKSVHYADEAIGEFISGLDEAGLLENTVIVIYGDHDAKLKKADYNLLYNYDFTTNAILDKNDPSYISIDQYDMELNKKVPFIIWTKDGKYKEEVKEVMGMYNILPTLGNMFGFESKYALGMDIFDPEPNVVIFPDGNWLTDKMYYNNQRKEGKLLDINKPVSLEEIEKYSNYAEELVSVSDSIIVYDLIRKSKDIDSVHKGNGE